ncbi:MAG: hypothetical protein B9J98_01310 [Candidatus Terraquivivens tikiterensis]|uniref:Uncharacterized protein n=1 Tax=Candidatus Terraquivivens tikiterensis TaxID=1980982 RepID=A0A2R7Y9P9_9ARCH|nr:MAG: hypothetical protein B9J98_01310 [Candidatus Terraquivivens tikiterensis]
MRIMLYPLVAAHSRASLTRSDVAVVIVPSILRASTMGRSELARFGWRKRTSKDSIRRIRIFQFFIL